MHSTVISAILLSILSLLASAAPVPEVAPRLIGDAPFVGIHDIARAIAPAVQPKDIEVVEGETEEARACRMYSCI
ncbi:hypothetical protein C8F01DRAFT_1361301 [Mycena amicta]|nr:hypothetical protein C8F01DRAFT_1361301 [Mycena amicta]